MANRLASCNRLPIIFRNFFGVSPKPNSQCRIISRTHRTYAHIPHTHSAYFADTLPRSAISPEVWRLPTCSDPRHALTYPEPTPSRDETSSTSHACQGTLSGLGSPPLFFLRLPRPAGLKARIRLPGGCIVVPVTYRVRLGVW